MTRLEAAVEAYLKLQPVGSVCEFAAMRAALDAADAWKSPAPRRLSQAFTRHFAEEWRNTHNGHFSWDANDMGRAIGVALEKAFEERERT